MKEFTTPCGITVSLADDEKEPVITELKRRKISAIPTINNCPIKEIRDGNLSAFSGICPCDKFIIDTTNAEGDGISR